jgi:hypothetical protein
MKKIAIFCEGKNEVGNQSLDIKILNKFFKSAFPQITIIPFGGKRSMKAFIDGYIQQKGVMSLDLCIGLRDRDFDFPIPAISSIISIAEKSNTKQKTEKIIFATYRTCIENYLFDPNLLTQFVLSKRVRGQENLQSSQMNEWLKESVRNIQFYTAARHALGKVQIAVKISTSWTSDSGKLPKELDKEFCLSEAKKIIKTFLATSNKATITDLETAFDTFITKFTTQEFYNSDEYLVYPNGKDIQTAFSKLFLSYTKHPFPSWNEYYDFAIKETDFNKFEDLRELYQIIGKELNP